YSYFYTMPELKYIITADDSKFKKTLANASKEAASNSQKLSDSVKKAVASETANRQVLSNAITTQQRSLQSLQIQLASYQAVAAKATGPAVLAKYNAEIQKTQEEINRLSNVGKRGFD